MEELLALFAWLVFSLFAEVVGEFFLEFTSNLSQEDTPKSLAVPWFSLVGLVVGAASVLMAGTRVLKPGLFTGISLFEVDPIF